jgi:hypothetical protein
LNIVALHGQTLRRAVGCARRPTVARAMAEGRRLRAVPIDHRRLSSAVAAA